MRRTASRSWRADRPPGFGGAGAGRVGRIAHVDVDRQEHAVAVVPGDRERLGQAVGQAALDDLGHLVGAHPLLGHPAQGLRFGPVAAQADLQEPVTADRPGLDQPAHGLAVPDQGAELRVAGVGVRVEVDQGHPALAEVLGHAGRVGPGDGVVAAEDQRDGAVAGHLVHRGLQVAHGPGRVAGEHLHVPGVVDAQILQAVGAQRQRGPGPVVRQVVGLPDVLRAEPGPGPVGGAAVERGPDDHHVGVRVAGRVGPVTAVHTEERDVRAELRSVARHGPVLPDRGGWRGATTPEDARGGYHPRR